MGDEDSINLIEKGEGPTATAPPPHPLAPPPYPVIAPAPIPDPPTRRSVSDIECDRIATFWSMILMGVICYVWYKYVTLSCFHLFMVPIEHYNSFQKTKCDVLDPQMTDVQYRYNDDITNDINKVCVVTLWSPLINKSIVYMSHGKESMAFDNSAHAYTHKDHVCNKDVCNCWVSEERKIIVKKRRRHSNKIFWSFLLLGFVGIINILMAASCFAYFRAVSNNVMDRMNE